MEMSVADAAKFLNVSERTIFRRLKTGSLQKKPDSELLLVLIDTDSPDIITDSVMTLSVMMSVVIFVFS